MVVKSLFVIYVSAIFIQNISSQCIGNQLTADEMALTGLRYSGSRAFEPAPYGGTVSPGYIAPASGGNFPISSSSPIPPIGISIISENAIEGALTVTGEIPFLGAVALEGNLPTFGSGGINYGCGNEAVGIVSENLGSYGPGIGPNQFGYASSHGGPGYPAPGFPEGLKGYGPVH